jgi:HAD superfamily hydrolase (TIGR01490 family)
MTAAAFFDLDRTLISGASAFPFAVEAWRAGLVSNREIARWTLAALMFLLSGDKGDDVSDNARSEFLDKVAGVSVEQLDSIAREMLPNLVNDIRPESKKLLQMHHDAGRETWIVSASPQKIVEPLAQALGMDGAIGTRGTVVDGHYTAELDGPFVYGDGKAEAIRALADDRAYDLEKSYAYSDSISDLPMLETVGHPVAVNPDGVLERIAYERGWPIVIFARRTKRVIAFGSAGTLATGGMVAAYLVGRHHGQKSRRLALFG